MLLPNRAPHPPTLLPTHPPTLVPSHPAFAALEDVRSYFHRDFELLQVDTGPVMS